MDDVRTPQTPSEAAWGWFLAEFRVWCESEEAGKFFTLPDFPSTQFMVLYHPAALLYNAKLKPAMWQHAKTLRRFLDQHDLIRSKLRRAQ